MSIIKKQFKRGGALTDVDTSFKLSDEDGTYGVKRNDLSGEAAVVVADDTDMTRVSEGLYEYEFVDPDNDLTYTAAFEIVHSGDTIRFTDTFDGPKTEDIGYTVAELLTRISYSMGWNNAHTSAQAARAYQSITAVGRAAATWQGEKWWWATSVGEFDSVENTASYNLRTVNSSDMSDLLAVEQAFYDDDHQLLPMTWLAYQQWNRLSRPNTSTTKPQRYAQSGTGPSIYLVPVPDDAYTIYISYRRRHPKIDSTSFDSDLIIPAEVHDAIYVDGALWLLRTDVANRAGLDKCPGFVEGIDRLYASRPQAYDLNQEDRYGPDAPMAIPASHPFIGGHITDLPSL